MTADAELVARYRAAAAQHRKATTEGDYKAANKAHDVVAGAYRQLRTRGLPSQQLLLALLDDEDHGVRAWAAAHALEFAPDRGEPVLEALTRATGLVSLDAKYTLREWRKGALKFP